MKYKRVRFGGWGAYFSVIKYHFRRYGRHHCKNLGRYASHADISAKLAPGARFDPSTFATSHSSYSSGSSIFALRPNTTLMMTESE